MVGDSNESFNFISCGFGGKKAPNKAVWIENNQIVHQGLWIMQVPNQQKDHQQSSASWPLQRYTRLCNTALLLNTPHEIETAAEVSNKMSVSQHKPESVLSLKGKSTLWKRTHMFFLCVAEPWCVTQNKFLTKLQNKSQESLDDVTERQILVLFHWQWIRDWICDLIVGWI